MPIIIQVSLNPPVGISNQYWAWKLTWLVVKALLASGLWKTWSWWPTNRRKMFPETPAILAMDILIISYGFPDLVPRLLSTYTIRHIPLSRVTFAASNMGVLELLGLLETCLWLLVMHWRRGQWGVGVECSEEVIPEEDLANLIRALRIEYFYAD